jgi:hypothetical protein
MVLVSIAFYKPNSPRLCIWPTRRLRRPNTIPNAILHYFPSSFYSVFFSSPNISTYHLFLSHSLYLSFLFLLLFSPGQSRSSLQQSLITFQSSSFSSCSSGTFSSSSSFFLYHCVIIERRSKQTGATAAIARLTLVWLLT